MARRFFIFLVLFIVPISIGEAWLRNNLWEYASYTNSASIDEQLKQWSYRKEWDFVFVGDSEVRWGINPISFESGLLQKGIAGLSAFNHGMDGFGGTWWSLLIPKLFKENRKTKKVKRFIVVGVQMTNDEQFWEDSRFSSEEIPCGELQRPVITSGFGIDLKLNHICDKKEGLHNEVNKLIDLPMWLIRYRSSIKSLVLPVSTLQFNSAKIADGFRGYEPHAPIANNPKEFESEFGRWKNQFDQSKPFSPMPTEGWNKMVNYGGYFDQMSDLIRSLGLEPIFFALPTNPLVIDYLNRRESYIRNSQLLSEWSKSRGVIVINLGIQDRADSEQYFSDMRHLSYIGAGDFSLKLGVAIANHPLFKKNP